MIRLSCYWMHTCRIFLPIRTLAVVIVCKKMCRYRHLVANHEKLNWVGSALRLVAVDCCSYRRSLYKLDGRRRLRLLNRRMVMVGVRSYTDAKGRRLLCLPLCFLLLVELNYRIAQCYTTAFSASSVSSADHFSGDPGISRYDTGATKASSAPVTTSRCKVHRKQTRQ